MGDEQDALALGSQILHDLHELFDLLRGQHGGRLVEDQDLVVAVQHLEDLGALLHADGDILDQRVGVDGQAVLLREGHDLFPGLLLLQETVLRGLDAQDDVVQNGEALDQLEVLVHHADAKIVGVVRVLDLDLLAVLLDGALLGLIQAEQYAHQGGLASAVLTQQGVDLALFQLERDIVVGDDAGESLRDVKHLDCVRTLQAYLPPSSKFSYETLSIIILQKGGDCKYKKKTVIRKKDSLSALTTKKDRPFGLPFSIAGEITSGCPDR